MSAVCLRFPEQKMNLLQQAVRLDPKYSQANYQLGRLYWEKKNIRSAAEYLQKVAQTDDHFREAMFLLGLCRFYTADYAGAQESFQLVSRTVPLNEVLNNLGVAQLRRKMLDEALVNLKKALDGDFADPDYQFNVGYALYKQSNYPAAAERFRAVLERVPDDKAATTMLGFCLKQQNIRPSDIRLEGLERLKTNYEESAYWQLKAVLEPSVEPIYYWLGRCWKLMVADPGCVRPNNEDYYLLVPGLDLYLVADGMGGAQAGEHASKLAVETVAHCLSDPPNARAETLLRAVEEANRRVLDAAGQDARFTGWAPH